MMGKELLFALGLVGRAMVLPARALRAVEEHARGGKLAAVLLVFVAAPLSRASILLPRVWDVDRGSGVAKRIATAMFIELVVAIALASGVLVLLRARVERARRRPQRDVQLAATCILPAL